MSDTAPGSGGPVLRSQFQTADADEFEAFIRQTYVDISMDKADDRPFECGHDVMATPEFSISQMWVTATLFATVGPTEGQFVVEQIHDGGMIWDHPDHGEVRTGPGSGVVLPRTGEYSDLIDQLEFDLVTLDEDALTRYVADVFGLGPESLVLQGLSPVSDGRQRRWNAAVRHVRDDVLGNPLLIDTPIVLDTAFRALASAFLETFPVAGREAMQEPPRGRVDRTRLRDAHDYLAWHAGRAVPPGELVHLTGMPVAHLAAGMRREYGTTPSRVLWWARLRGLREDLQAAGPGSDPAATVTAHASRWGFTHPGRLRVAYRRVYGELPETTLGRH